MPRTFVLTHDEGGIEKSTSATNIAYGLVGLLMRSGAANFRMLLVDTDNQAHASVVTTGH